MFSWDDEPRGKRRTTVPKSSKILVWNIHIGTRRVEGPCYVCGRTVHRDDFDVGHVKAKSKGGSDLPENLRPICRTCNGSMGTMSLETFKTRYFGRSKPSESVNAGSGRSLANPKETVVKCPNCRGKGEIHGPPGTSILFAEDKKCPSCKGQGKLTGSYVDWKRCQKCKGWAKFESLFESETCKSCKGRGVVAPI